MSVTALDILDELVRGRSVAQDEGVLARRAGGLLDSAGFTVALPRWEPGREQLVARTGGAVAPLTLTGHLDTVPATPRSGPSTLGLPSGTATGSSAAARAT